MTTGVEIQILIKAVDEAAAVLRSIATAEADVVKASKASSEASVNASRRTVEAQERVTKAIRKNEQTAEEFAESFRRSGARIVDSTERVAAAERKAGEVAKTTAIQRETGEVERVRAYERAKVAALARWKAEDDAIRAHNAEVARASRVPPVIADAQVTARRAVEATTVAMNKQAAVQRGLTENQRRTLIYTASDLVSSSAYGINPQQFLIQQGPQVLQAFAVEGAGLKAMFAGLSRGALITAGAIAGVAVAAGIGALVLKSLAIASGEEAERQQQLAQSLGTTVQGYGQLKLAAELNSIPQATLNQGLASLSGWMMRNGQSGRDLNVVLREQAAEFAAMAPSAERSRLAQERFGASYDKFLRLFDRGGLDEAAALQERYALAHGPDAVANLEAYRRAVVGMGLAWEGLKTTIGSSVLPALTATAQVMERIVGFARDNPVLFGPMAMALLGGKRPSPSGASGGAGGAGGAANPNPFPAEDPRLAAMRAMQSALLSDKALVDLTEAKGFVGERRAVALNAALAEQQGHLSELLRIERERASAQGILGDDGFAKLGPGGVITVEGLALNQRLSVLLSEIHRTKQQIRANTAGASLEALREEIRLTENRNRVSTDAAEAALAANRENFRLTGAEKQREELRLLNLQQREIEEQTEALRARAAALALNPDLNPAERKQQAELIEAEQERLRSRGSSLGNRRAGLEQGPGVDSYGDNVLAGITAKVTGIGTAAQAAATLTVNTLGTAVNGLANGLTGLATGTATFAEAWQQAENAIVGNIIQMGLDYLIFNNLRLAADRIFYGQKQVQDTTTHSVVRANMVGTAATGAAAAATAGAATSAAASESAAAAAPAAAANSIWSFGSAAGIGLALALAAIVGITAALAFNTGGVVPGSGPNRDSVFAHLTPGEVVIDRDTVNAWGGPEYFRSVGLIGGGRGASTMAGGVPVQAYNSGGTVAPMEGGQKQVSVLFFDSRSDAQKYGRDAKGEVFIMDVARKQKHLLV